MSKMTYVMINCDGMPKGKVPNKMPDATIMIEVIGDTLDITVLNPGIVYKPYYNGTPYIPLSELGLRRAQDETISND